MAGNNKSNRQRLIGWLVSYAMDERGKAYEIRSGRSLIGSKGLQGTICTLNDNSVSDIHLAVHASTDHKVQVQDVFSEAGTYVTRAGSQNEKEVAGPVELSHGDWLRIGESVRFQVCLIDGASN